jgi:signal peptidase
MNQAKTKKFNPLGALLSLAQMLLIIALLVVAVMSFGTRVPLLAQMGFNFFAVTSGSMEPTIPTGALVYTGKYKLEDLKKGDVITYRKVNPETKEIAVVTHRIDEVKKDELKQNIEENGKKAEKTTLTYAFKTKGDANNVADSYEVNPSEIIGLYKWHVPKIGYISIFAQKPQGFILLVIVPAVILILWEVVSLVVHFKKHYEEKSQSEINKLKEQLAQKEANAQT